MHIYHIIPPNLPFPKGGTPRFDKEGLGRLPDYVVSILRPLITVSANSVMCGGALLLRSGAPPASRHAHCRCIGDHSGSPEAQCIFLCSSVEPSQVKPERQLLFLLTVPSFHASISRTRPEYFIIIP